MQNAKCKIKNAKSKNAVQTMKNLNFLITFSALCLMLLGIIGCNADKQPAPPAKQGQELIDSLRTALAKSGQDTNRVNALNGLSEYAGWRIEQNDTCIAYAQKALTLARKTGYKYGMARAYSNLGQGQRRKSAHEEALKSHFTALNIFKETGNIFWEGAMYSNIANDYMAMADYPNALKYSKAAIQPLTEANSRQLIVPVYQRIGNINSQQGNFNEALKSYAIALNISKKINDKNGMAWAYANIAGVYISQGKYPKSLKNYISSLKIFESLEDKSGMANGYLGIGGIYYIQGNYPEGLNNFTNALKIYESIGDKKNITTCYISIGGVHSVQGNYTEAIKNLKTALEISESMRDKYQTINCYGTIGQTYQLQGNYSEALKNFWAALKISESIGSKLLIAGCYGSIGTVYTLMNNAREGKIWLQKSLALSKETGAKDQISNGYSGLAQADSAMSNFKSAFENYKLFIVYKDSIYNEDNTKKLTQTAMQYEFDKKQLADSLQNVQVKKLATEKLSKQKTYTAMGAGLAVLLLGFSGMVFRNNKKLAAEKQKSENLLHNILPEEVSAELKQRGATTAKEFDAVTVLFTDFVNFTTAGERMSPKELVEELHFCFKTFDQIIDQYAIEKIKTVGDAYLAVSGLPNAHPQHAQNIVKAAKEIRDFMLARRAALGDKTFEVRLGIHSGSVVAGIVGVKKFAYDIWGDTVNTAARMEQSGEAGKVNISETTYQLVKEDFTCTYRGEIEAKGKGMMKMFFVA